MDIPSYRRAEGGGEVGMTVLKTSECVNVVRCKDCRYAHLTYDGDCKYCDMRKDQDGFCEELYLPGDYYCADGERREENDTE